MFSNNYFYELPIDIQNKIFFEIHKTYMREIKKNLLKIIILRILRKNDWLNHHSISQQLLSTNISLTFENGLESMNAG